jgi:threonyl-tRNA synthetase
VDAGITRESNVDLTSVHLPTSDESDELLRIRHSCAHIMAMAMQRVHRGTQVTIGPWIEKGFYYDFDMSGAEKPFADKILKKVQKEMRRLIRKDLPFVCEDVTADEARRRIQDLGEPYKLEILDSILAKYVVCTPFENHTHASL